MISTCIHSGSTYGYADLFIFDNGVGVAFATNRVHLEATLNLEPLQSLLELIGRLTEDALTFPQHDLFDFIYINEKVFQ